MPAQKLKLPSASPRRQAENKALWNEARSPAGADFFTFGYTGRRLSEILELLLAYEIRTVVDIRYNAISMYRPELSKANLSHRLLQSGLLYIHLRSLGVPREVRLRASGASSRDVIWEWYDEHVLPQYAGRNLHYLFNALEHPIALMCVEADPSECHRHRLFQALEELGLTGFDL